MSDESERVKKHKRSRMKDGYKNISFMVSPEEFKMIKKVRKERNMSTRELLVYFVSGQYSMDLFEHSESGYEYRDLTTEERYQKDYDEYGSAHKFVGKKKYVLLAYLSVDRKKVKIIKDFDTFDAAIEYYNNHKYKRRVELFYQHPYSEGWYEIRGTYPMKHKLDEMNEDNSKII